jgi:hypothetical protein
LHTLEVKARRRLQNRLLLRENLGRHQPGCIFVDGDNVAALRREHNVGNLSLDCVFEILSLLIEEGIPSRWMGIYFTSVMELELNDLEQRRFERLVDQGLFQVLPGKDPVRAWEEISIPYQPNFVILTNSLQDKPRGFRPHQIAIGLATEEGPYFEITDLRDFIRRFYGLQNSEI